MQIMPEVTVSAQKLISDSVGEAATIAWGESVHGYPHVYRGEAHFASRHEPMRIILKFPQKPHRWARLCNDWAGCQFLQSIPGTRSIGPHSFGGDSALRFTISQEVDGQTLAEIASISLSDFAQTLGRMHAGTIGLQQEYLRLRKSIGPAEEHSNFDLPGRVRSTRNLILSQCRSWETEVSDRLIDEIDAILQAIEDAGPYLVYTHIDLNPGNLILMPGNTVRIIDFDSGAFRHALLDGVWPRMAFPGHWPALILPPNGVLLFESAYRRELSRTLGAAVDEDDRFYSALTDACAFWTLIRLSWVAEAIFDAIPNIERTTHLRHQAIVALDRFVSTVQETGLRPELGRMAEALLAFAGKQWDDRASEWLVPMPVFEKKLN